MENILKSKRFWPLLITQFLGALNDNLFKNALLTLVAIKMTAQSDILSNVIAGLFILPFFLFSAWAGEFADKYNRDKIARILKVTEIILMTGVAIAYAFNSLLLLIILITLMGTQSAFFGPIKYALLPQQLQSDELITGNAYIEASTYMAILLGLILGTLLPIWGSIILLITLAISGYMAARQILPAPAPRPDLKINRNLFVSGYENFIFLKKHRYILQSILGASWFWIIGAFAAVQIYPLCTKIISAGNGTITFFLILFSLGVAFGSYCCNKILKGSINMIYVPLSAIGMAICLCGLWILSHNYPTAEHLLTFKEFLRAPHACGFSFCLFMLAFFGGLYIIPLNAFMQNRAPKAYTATVIAGNNIINSLGMVGVSVFAIILLKLGFTLPQLFLIMGMISFAVALYICILLPDNLTRSILQTILRLMFRTEVKGLNHFYKAGKRILIISNHTSLWDGVLLAAFMPERITFAITSAWTGKWFMPIIRLLVDFYPVDPTNPLSIRKLIELVRNGHKVMIFPEGRISLTGKLMQVYDGAAMIAAKSGAKILPVRIDGAQYSTMSYVKDKFRSRTFPQINLTILPAQKFEADLQNRSDIQRQLYALMTEMMFQTSPRGKSLYAELIAKYKLYGRNKIILRALDGSRLTAAQLLRQASGLAKKLHPLIADKQKIGVCIENPLAFLMTLTALDYLKKTIILPDIANAAVQLKTAGAETVIGYKFKSEVSCPYIELPAVSFLSNLRPGKPTIGETKIIFFKNGHIVEHSMSDLLENYNKLDCVLPFNNKDKALNSIPLWNADNFVPGILLTLLSGVETLHYAGKHQKLIPHICYDYAATALFANEAVYKPALSEASPFDFFSMRMAFAIGDKFEDTLLEQWLKQFGIRILENYTPNDSALIEAINTPLYNRFGTLGQPLPKVKILNRQTDKDGFIL